MRTYAWAIWITFAPSNDLSNSVDDMPSFRGLKRFECVTAKWIGIKQNMPTSHSPSGNSDVAMRGHCSDGHSCDEVTLICFRIPLVGFLVLASKSPISKAKYCENFGEEAEETNKIDRASWITSWLVSLLIAPP